MNCFNVRCSSSTNGRIHASFCSLFLVLNNNKKKVISLTMARLVRTVRSSRILESHLVCAKQLFETLKYYLSGKCLYKKHIFDTFCAPPPFMLNCWWCQYRIKRVLFYLTKIKLSIHSFIHSSVRQSVRPFACSLVRSKFSLLGVYRYNSWSRLLTSKQVCLPYNTV